MNKTIECGDCDCDGLPLAPGCAVAHRYTCAIRVAYRAAELARANAARVAEISGVDGRRSGINGDDFDEDELDHGAGGAL